jgi:phenylpropionate dioxygenase-like ring-hydroxylating dioxygenase large terminal subunit
MLSAERNDLITRSGPGTRLGALLRRYWQPAALTDQLAGDRPVTRVRLLGETFVLFRDDQGRPGLLDSHCAHRGADLCYGRTEDGGLRCPFHGWLYDVNGVCLDLPAEPDDSNLRGKRLQPSYPCIERNGIIFAFLGPGTPPPLPDFDCFRAPDAYTFAFKGMIACNWLQALEVGIDPAHASFLHRFFQDEDSTDSYGKPFRGDTLNADTPMTRILREFPRPDIQVQDADFGLRIAALRRLNETDMHIRVTNLVFPQAFAIPMDKTMTITQWHVPIDDTHCYWYAIFTSFTRPVDKAHMRAQRLELYELPDYVPRKNQSNDYGFDPYEQRTSTYTGMGADINVHDQWAVESMGAIQDRTREHLGQTDKAIIRYRRMLLKAIEDNDAGRDPPQPTQRTGPPSIDVIGPVAGWQAFWLEQDRRRREAAAWPAATTEA